MVARTGGYCVKMYACAWLNFALSEDLEVATFGQNRYPLLLKRCLKRACPENEFDETRGSDACFHLQENKVWF